MMAKSMLQLACFALVLSVVTVSAQTSGRCLNSDDMLKLSKITYDQQQDYLTKCGVQCETDDVCMEDCMQRFTLVSNTCATCFGDFTLCAIDSCLFECIDASAPECNQCTTLNCGPGLTKCIGSSSQVGCNDFGLLADITTGTSSVKLLADVATDLCNNPSDIVKLDSQQTLKSQLKQCAAKCTADPYYSGNCMQQTLGVSTPCKSCFDQFAACSNQNCYMDCFSDPTTAVCENCTTVLCSDTLTVCMGSSSQSGCTKFLDWTVAAAEQAVKIVSDVALASCSAADVQALGTEEVIIAELKKCAALCTSETTFTGNCMQASFGISNACKTCFDAFNQCATDNCKVDCFADPTGAACETCTTQMCKPALKNCIGM